MSIFELINLILRLIPWVKDYQGDDSRMSSTNEHIGSGLVFSLIIGFAFSFPANLISGLILWSFYALFRELVIDSNKNKNFPAYHTIAQIIERSAGFIVGAGICILIKWIKGEI